MPVVISSIRIINLPTKKFVEFIGRRGEGERIGETGKRGRKSGDGE
jgi:hypothetical protein